MDRTSNVSASPYSMHRDIRIEQCLNRHGLLEYTGSGPLPEESWQFVENYPLKRIDREKSLKNQARGETPLIQEHLKNLKIVQSQGITFPAIVVALGEPDFLHTGNHRTELAREAGHDFLNVYLIRTNVPENHRLLPFELNEIGEHPTSKRTLLNKAVEEYLNHGLSLEESAAKFKVQRHEIQSEASVRRYNDYFPNVVKGSEKLDYKIKKEIQDSVVVLTYSGAEELCRVALNTPGIVAHNIEELRKQYKNAKGSEEQKSLLAGMETSIRQQVARRTRGGAVKNRPGREKKTLDKAKLLKSVNALIDEARKPQGNFTGFNPEEGKRIYLLILSLSALGSIDLSALDQTAPLPLPVEDKKQTRSAAKASVKKDDK